MPSKFSDYSPVSGDDESAKSFLHDKEDNTPKAVPPRRTHIQTVKSYMRTTYNVLLHVFVVATFGLVYIRYRRDNMDLRVGHFSRHEYFYAPTDAPISYYDKIITTAWENNTFLDPWGGDGPEVDKKWEDLLSGGIVRLTHEETARLPFTPAKLYKGHEGEYAGFMEVFHHLHCLNRIRRNFYNPDAETDPGLSPEFTRQHNEHCFDYLRQNILCYSDLSVLPIGWDSVREKYIAGFDTKIPKICRNFDAIKQWANERRPEHAPPGSEEVHIGG